MDDFEPSENQATRSPELYITDGQTATHLGCLHVLFLNIYIPSKSKVSNLTDVTFVY